MFHQSPDPFIFFLDRTNIDELIIFSIPIGLFSKGTDVIRDLLGYVPVTKNRLYPYYI
jgi:hypothetical protein